MIVDWLFVTGRSNNDSYNNASVSAEVGFATISPYSASKHAVASLSKVAALEYAGSTIRVNALAPARWTPRCSAEPPMRSERPRTTL